MRPTKRLKEIMEAFLRDPEFIRVMGNEVGRPVTSAVKWRSGVVHVTGSKKGLLVEIEIKQILEAVLGEPGNEVH